MVTALETHVPTSAPPVVRRPARRRPRRPGWLRSLGQGVVVAALVALPGLSLNRVYSGVLLAALVAGAAAAAALLSVLLHRRSAIVLVPVTLAGLVGYALWALGTAARASATPGDLATVGLDAARNAVPRLLTALIPVQPQPDTVLAPVVLAWLASLAATELAVRAARPAAALAPPTLLYGAALVVVGSHARTAVWQPLTYAALCALALVLGTATSGTRGLRLSPAERTFLRVRTATGVVIGLAAILAVAVAASPLVTGAVSGSPGDPRRYVEPPALDVTDANPLMRIAGWAAFPEQRLFQVSFLGTDSATGDTRLRLAVLPDWDGVTWRLEADFRDAGRELPPAPDPAPPYLSQTLEQQITIADLRGRLLPAVAWPTRVDGVRVAYDGATGTLLDRSTLAAGVSYTVTSTSPTIGTTPALGALVPSGPAVARYLEVGPAVPAGLQEFATRVTRGTTSPYDQAIALQAFMQEHYTFARDAPSGHAYPNLGFFLLADPRVGGQRGTSEQFAAAFAALGRLLGLPTRVVVGFHVPDGGGTVTAGDAVAWPEVLFEGIGWVPFDPLPPEGTVPRAVEPEFVPPPPPSSEPSEPEPSPSATTVAATPTGGRAAPAGRSAPWGAIAQGAAVGVVGLLALAMLVIVIARSARRRRHLAGGDPAHRVLGAWDEVLDTLTLAGHPPAPSLTARDVASHAAQVLHGVARPRDRRRVRPAAPPLDGLARAVTEAAFGGPSLARPDETLARRARQRALAFRRAVYKGRSWWRRLLWWFDPRPLRRR